MNIKSGININPMAKKKTPAQRGRDKVRPDQGQGSEGNFGRDGDWGSDNDELKKAQRESSPITIKKAK
jgi:hypothetical protein